MDFKINQVKMLMHNARAYENTIYFFSPSTEIDNKLLEVLEKSKEAIIATTNNKVMQRR